ncbi:Uncharacterised protein [Vibrio cholerae]|nr:Uncharacterised protein [Vibrio cholerae]CSI37769.1 Uncharacterised protein [Vibrio cholerae]
MWFSRRKPHQVDCLTLKFGPRAEMANDIALYACTLPIVVLLYALPSRHSTYSHVIKGKLST